jgi:chaperone BCS1
MPTHPKMTDDSLKEAINSLPTETIVVFEDIDSLFSKDRSNKISSSALTFSGLLNALDGIGNPKGQIFVLTTNLRDQLDQALIRNGRVDLHIEFTYADSEQMETMWTNFYPEAAHLARNFSNNLQGLLRSERLQITTANMQHFFVTQMDYSAQEALDNVSSIVDEVKLNSTELVKASRTQQVDGSGATTSINDAVSEVKSSDDPSSK